MNILNEFTMIKEDKGLYKKVLKSGNGPSINSGNKVIINIKGIDELASIVQEYDNFEYEIDSNALPKGCNEGLKTMNVGEISVFVMRSDYGFVKTDNNSKSDLIYYIEILDLIN